MYCALDDFKGTPDTSKSISLAGYLYSLSLVTCNLQAIPGDVFFPDHVHKERHPDEAFFDVQAFAMLRSRLVGFDIEV